MYCEGKDVNEKLVELAELLLWGDMFFNDVEIVSKLVAFSMLINISSENHGAEKQVFMLA